MNEKAKEYVGRERYTFEDLCGIMKILRGEGGCPWDREQTHKSIRNDFIDETYEAIEAIDTDNTALLCEELGDVMLQVVFHAEIESEAGRFNINDVTDGICKKLIYRHPHVFGEEVVSGSDEVLVNWDALKAKEKSRDTVTAKLKSVSASAPALMKAHKLGKISRKAGFDFETAEDAFEKISEETAEVCEEMRKNAQGENRERLTEEIGDLLLAVVNTSRLLGIDAEEALDGACRKYVGRFEAVEDKVLSSGKKIEGMTQKELDLIWDEVKKS
ncbi:MAG: nucleoside triphosphate pyrophosphohydrolase [Firmicutes bacterium]|nr:nucleoside triphosphate pyrophosphohydrolase [Bacillota bacterium]